MHKRSCFHLVIVLLGLSMVARLAAAEDRPSRPNILFIMSDDHASHAISAYGSRINQTPQIDRLAKEGMLETLAGILMLQVHLPLADGRELVLPRYTQPEPEQRLVREKVGRELPPQPPPRIRPPQAAATAKAKETKSKL